MRYYNRGYHWAQAKNPRLRELAEWEAYLDDPSMQYAEDEHDGTINVIFGSTGATITLGIIDAEASSLFSYGHCAILAWEIHVKTGLEMAVFTNPDSQNSRWSGHVALKVGDDRFLDIQGVSSSKEISRRYPRLDGSYEILSDEEFKDLLVGSEYTDDPKAYLCELEQLVLETFVDLVIEENVEAVESALLFASA